MSFLIFKFLDLADIKYYWLNLEMDSLPEPDIEKLKDYILKPDLLIHKPYPNIIPRTYNVSLIFDIPYGLASTKLVPKRDGLTGEIISFMEIELDNVGANALNSTSMKREPGLLDEFTYGSAMNYPFWPGGFEDPPQEILKWDTTNFKIEGKLLTTPPGLSKGYEFDKNESNLYDPEQVFSSDNLTNKKVNLLKNLEEDVDVQEWLRLTKSSATDYNESDDENDNKTEEKNEFRDSSGKKLKYPNEIKELDNQIMTTASDSKLSVLEISNTKSTEIISKWAEMLDVTQSIDDFHERIPCPAKEFDFELDTFQKQAILKLEERQYVLVAAHTSAGKTVVAEYAIALSQRDLTRAVYTSPIKALSNQKYRDFKKIFKDVGLITGDLQIDPTAGCLIMTTEILRSMLYCGSDITRDLEYVIFDEVHYINNPERGHVWEEIIILLPDHVNIIMLSATVPNTMELADWVGSTKKRKVYVISTLKRPVPLMHYLYTGVGGKSKDDITLLVDADGNFLQENYEIAVTKKKVPRSGWKNSQVVSMKQDQNMWIGLIDFLKRNDKMPVVAFTLSRNRCDINAQVF